MRALFIFAIMSAYALMGSLVYTQPTRASSDRATSQPELAKSAIAPKIGAVAEAKREEAALAHCDAEAAKKQIKSVDREAFIEQCLLAVDSTQGY
jgi:hypothetical protein